ncbi:MAG: flagellar hook-basal body complex protein FliE [Methylococcales bacterium]|jgi:flagellar hook-basal body complex protein FliE|nr:flagellar hook-basal body complex protein FliE [Methylococcales bacterium]MDD5754687.1 flagellar hook-basal body complex protein FliE [Methylococcales bacterium]
MNDIRIAPALEQIRNLSIAAGSKVPEVPSEGIDFGSLLKQAIDNVNEKQQISGNMKSAFEGGDKTINLAEVMVASQKSDVSFKAMLQVRNKLVEAYKDVMNMPM